MYRFDLAVILLPDEIEWLRDDTPGELKRGESDEPVGKDP